MHGHRGDGGTGEKIGEIAHGRLGPAAGLPGDLSPKPADEAKRPI